MMDDFHLTPLAANADAADLLEALGPLEESIVQGLIGYAQGNPGMLLELLAWCFRRDLAQLLVARALVASLELVDQLPAIEPEELADVFGTSR